MGKRGSTGASLNGRVEGLYRPKSGKKWEAYKKRCMGKADREIARYVKEQLGVSYKKAKARKVVPGRGFEPR